MPSNALAGYGSLLKRGASTSGSASTNYNFVTVSEVKSIKGPNVEVSVLDVTTHSSAASGNYREKVPSLIDPGTIEVEMNWVPTDTTIQGLRSDMTARTKRDWQIWPAGTSYSINFSGYVTAFPLEFPVDDVIGGTITITLTGSHSVDLRAWS